MSGGPFTIVVDLDGTLCDNKRREHHAQNKEWDEFHAGIPEDEPHADVAALVKVFSAAGYWIVACTGRPAKHRLVTESWLVSHGIQIDEVLMRPDGDHRPDTVVKLELMEQWALRSSLDTMPRRPQDEVLFVLDDRARVVEAWRNAGYNCWQVRHGGY